MKINEIADVVQHPAVKRQNEFTKLINSSKEEIDGIIEFIMDDNNAERLRLKMLRHFDRLFDDEQETYTAADLDDFLHNQGPITDWRDELRGYLDDVKSKRAIKQDALMKRGEFHPFKNVQYSNDNPTKAEIDQLYKELKFPPYHLSIVKNED